MSTLVYRVPGNHQMPGGSFDYRQAKDDEHLAELLSEGWFRTLPEAVDGDHVDTSAPSREELEQKARELELKFDGRTSNAKLERMIDEALEA